MKRKQLFIFCALWAVFLSGSHLSNAAATRARVQIPDSIVGQVLNHRSLQWVFGAEVPERLPVKVSSHLVNPRFQLYKFGQKVRVVPEAQLKSGAFLRFTDFAVKGNMASVGIRYEAEGAGGRFGFRRLKNATWKLIGAEVWET